MVVVKSIAELRRLVHAARGKAGAVGFVPTMGALHRGHAALVQRAREECGFVVVSIFVNPTQFGPNEDYLQYPRSLSQDAALCSEYGADLVFAPELEDIYPAPQRAVVEVGRLGDHLCGPFRPGHFSGVATVVLKFFNIVQPDRAYFGEKDYQQLCIVRRMARDFNLPLEVVGCATVREPDGLALSSRNAYLSIEERQRATALFQALEAARQAVETGTTDAASAKAAGLAVLGGVPGVRVEYFDIVDPEEVQPVSRIEGRVRIAAAIRVGKTRLIDNVPANDSLH